MSSRVVYSLVAIITAVVVYGVFFTSPQASPQPEQRVKHYAAQRPANVPSALSLLNQQTHAIGEIVQQSAALSMRDMERIHELSYSLESIQEVLAQYPQMASFAARLSPVITQLHDASEHHQQKQTRIAYDRLAALLHAPVSLPETENQSRKPLLR